MRPPQQGRLTKSMSICRERQVECGMISKSPKERTMPREDSGTGSILGGVVDGSGTGFWIAGKLSARHAWQGFFLGEQ